MQSEKAILAPAARRSSELNIDDRNPGCQPQDEEMAMLKKQFDALTEAIDTWMNGRRGPNHFYNGEKRNPMRPSTVAIDPRRSVMPRVLAGLLIATAILMLTFVAATTVVQGFAGKGKARFSNVSIEQVAAAEYKKARTHCQTLSANAREACIADAHAAEQRARAVSLARQRDYIAELRAHTDAAIDAGDRDRIIVEPACNLVARGQGSLCEIQVKPKALGGLGTNLIPARMTAAQFAEANPPRPARPVYVSRPAPVETIRNPFERSEVPAPQPARIFDLAWSSRQ